MRPSTLASILTLSVAVLAGCEDTTSPPDMAEVAGSYEATTLIGHSEAGDVDILAQGGSLTLTLTADGATTGTVFAPGQGEDGTNFTADLTGTWSLDGTTVTFEHDADTFIRDVAFTYEEGRLVSSSAFADVVLSPR